jgi:hypothetical protein
MAKETTIIDDLVMLGRGAPDLIKDGRVTVCAAGWSPTRGFIRIYPTRMGSPLKQWSIVSVPVERNEEDNREESWKISGSKSEWDRLDRKIKVVGELSRVDRQQLIPKLASPCILALNDTHASLGIVHPKELKGYLDRRSDVDHTVQQTLFGGSLPRTKATYDLQPRLVFTCAGCTSTAGHDQQSIEYGCYEWFRKNPGQEAQVFENLHLSDPGWERYLFVGNQTHHRASFLVITLLRWKLGPAQPTF